MIVHRSSRRIILVSPDLVKEFLARGDSARRGRELLHELELLSGQSDGLAGACRLHADEIDARIAEGQTLTAFVAATGATVRRIARRTRAKISFGLKGLVT
jgi:hypothetical protein